LAAGVELVRPLLKVTRSDVLAYLQTLHQPYREDSSNLDRRLTRNRIRHELMPFLALRFNPRVVPALCQLAEEAGVAGRRQHAKTVALLKRFERPRAGGRIIMDRRELAKLTRRRIREMFRLVWEREGWPAGCMAFAAWDRLAGLALGETPAIDLPQGIRAKATSRVVQLWRDS
jgi:tRNA(Ile)-lysidine synthase